MRRLAALFIALLVASPATAHDFWIQPARFHVAPGASVPLSFQIGHGADRRLWSPPADRVVRLDSIGPDGRTQDWRAAIREGLFATPPVLPFQTPGVHVVAFETTPIPNVLEADRFNAYLRAEGLTVALAARERMGATGAPGRELYSRRAKALVAVGSPGQATAHDGATRPAGLSLEIVPEVDPYDADAGDRLPVVVLLDGRPLPGALVKLNDLGADATPVEILLTDANGRADFTLRRTGEWQINVVWSEPLTDSAQADFETVFSSLTFGFSGPAQTAALVP